MATWDKKNEKPIEKMKKVVIVTILDNVNFGTFLQVLALGKILEAKGFNVEVVKYIRPTRTPKNLSKNFWSKNIVKNLYHFFLNIPLILLLRRKDHMFIKKHLPVSKKYTSFDALKHNPPMADIYLTGSDQVWNSYYNGGIDRSFYLDFAPSGNDKVAYGASIGMSDFPENEKKTTRELLEQYKSISVREQQAKQILENLGLQNIEVVLDPTLLLTKTDWEKLIDISVFKKKEPYLLVYSVEKAEDELVKDIALKVAQNKKMPIYCISSEGKLHGLRLGKKRFTRATPPHFISLFAQADFTVVSSFHGTAFSINMNKNFITISPSKFNSRIDNLLNICGLQERKISDIKSFSDKLLDDIDYSVVNHILTNERDKSMDFINKAIK